MACFTASVARGETLTKPTILRVPDAQRSNINHGGEPIGLSKEQTQQIFQGMEKAVQFGTAPTLQNSWDPHSSQNWHSPSEG